MESHGYGLRHADGTPHYSSGTTCYQWASKGFAMQHQTLATLRQKPQPFNKIRMTLFPKWYVYNHANPVETGAAFQILPGSPASDPEKWGCVGIGNNCSARLEGSFDLRRFNVSFWQNYERLLGSLQEMGVVADVIVFHPYDNGPSRHYHDFVGELSTALSDSNATFCVLNYRRRLTQPRPTAAPTATSCAYLLTLQFLWRQATGASTAWAGATRARTTRPTTPSTSST